MLDLSSFLATAEMALQTLSDAHLRRESPPGAVASNTTPWRVYLDRCERRTAPPLALPALRRLDLRLVEARSRLLAHRLRGHALRVATWRRTKRVQIALVPTEVDPTAEAELRAVARTIGAPATGPILQVVGAVLDGAGGLTKKSRRRVAELLRETGYESADPSLIVRDLLAVTATLI
jgi:hypothetical protein